MAGFQQVSEMSTSAQISPTAMPLKDAARLLSRLGQESVTQEMLESDVACGAPLNPDGTLNLIHYAAWLVKELATGGR
ncbi:hypothetical protein AYO47_06570 [Planctomyces sp. SCGC AG-212-M04]|nr:hypothetical protein AYO47_06570 [Planctomyces sp. SCGC AG-212-M04]